MRKFLRGDKLQHRKKIFVLLSIFALSIGYLVPANPALASDPIDSCAYNGQQHLEVFLNVDSPAYPVSATTVGGNIAWFQSQASGQEPSGGNFSADPTVGYSFTWEEMRAETQLIYSVYASGVFGSGPTGDPLCTMTINYGPAPQTSITSCTLEGQVSQTINVPQGTAEFELLYSSSGGNRSFLEILTDGELHYSSLISSGSGTLVIFEWTPQLAGSTRIHQLKAVDLETDPPQATGSVLCSVELVYAASSGGGGESQLIASNYFVVEGFKKGKHKLSAPMENFIKREIDSRQGESKAICTGTVRGKKWTEKREALALARAEAGCTYVSMLNPNLPVELKKRLIPNGKGNPLTVRIRVYY